MNTTVNYLLQLAQLMKTDTAAKVEVGGEKECQNIL